MHTEPTPIADFENPVIQELIKARRWRDLDTYARIGAVYHFVKDELPFGYNANDAMPASAVLEEGFGQCNTKSNLLLALLRALDIPARFHGLTIYKELQRGAIPAALFPLTPDRILHSWVEVNYDGDWLPLEGVILDDAYLKALQSINPDATEFCGFGVSTDSLQDPKVEWRGQPTYIQHEGIADDFGVFDSPDAFYTRHGINLSGFRAFAYQRVFRHWLNHTVQSIRNKNLDHMERPAPGRTM